MQSNPVLEECLRLSVDMRMLKYRSMPQQFWPNPDDEIWCPECAGRDDKCLFCLGEKRIQRRMVYSAWVACHGDDLEFGGKYCAKTFNILADGIAMLLLWQPLEVKLGNMVFRR